MLPADTKTFNKAVAMAQAGQKQEAYAILNDLVSRIKDSGNLYLWIAFTTPDMDEARYMINKAASIDPANPALGQAFNWLADEEAKLKVATPALAGVSSGSQASNAYTNSAPPPTDHYKIVSPASEPAQPDNSTYPEKGRRWLLPVVFGGAILLGVAGIVMLFYTLFIGDKIAMQGLPVYSNATRLDFGADRDKLGQFFEAMTFGMMKDVQYEAYTIKATEKSKALAYYDKELKSQGWKLSPSVTSDKDSLGYTKDKKVVMLSVFKSSQGNGTTILPGFNNKIQSDELFVMVMVAELNVNLDGFKF